MFEHVLKLSNSDLLHLANALRSKRLSSPFSEITIQRIISKQDTRNIVHDLEMLVTQGFSTEQLATLLELLLRDRENRTSTTPVALVTTGANPTGRDTAVVVRELFSGANESVLIAGYAVYQGQVLFQALADRMQENPSLKVRFFLDIQRPKDDVSTTDVLVKKFIYRFRQYQWPAERPIPDVYYYGPSLEISDKHSCLHAKCVVVDRQKVFISSANFTEAAQDRNIEMGLLLNSKALAGQIVTHFDGLISSGDLRKIT